MLLLLPLGHISNIRKYNNNAFIIASRAYFQHYVGCTFERKRFPWIDCVDVHTNGNIFPGLTVWDVHKNRNVFLELLVCDIHTNGNVFPGFAMCDIHTNENVFLGFAVWDVHTNGNYWVLMPRPITH